MPDEVEEAGADYLILDEGEITIPLFLEAIAQRLAFKKRGSLVPRAPRSGSLRDRIANFVEQTGIRSRNCAKTHFGDRQIQAKKNLEQKSRIKN
ncbi:MAG: hypothetical protein QNJ70_28675 [Xenococcaceae cyanobacterium MO_207.B15]|nr:hypothetical protein [Xenococcaceae cyanobacterium MO_207.B15]